MFSPSSARRQTPSANAPRSVCPSESRRCAVPPRCIPASRPEMSESVESSSCLYSSGYTLYGLPSGRRTACARSCPYPEPRRSISHWLLPILAVACTAAPPTVGRQPSPAGENLKLRGPNEASLGLVRGARAEARSNLKRTATHSGAAGSCGTVSWIGLAFGAGGVHNPLERGPDSEHKTGSILQCRCRRDDRLYGFNSWAALPGGR